MPALRTPDRRAGAARLVGGGYGPRVGRDGAGLGGGGYVATGDDSGSALPAEPVLIGLTRRGTPLMAQLAADTGRNHRLLGDQPQ